LLDDLGAEGIVITKRGKPVAKVIPIGSGCAALIGSMKGRLNIKGDLLSTGIRWNAEASRADASPTSAPPQTGGIGFRAGFDARGDATRAFSVVRS
jgi:antitoxin (DNA-binding transcriptional repressor) of toxin-antitoxin stability system